MGVRVHLCGRTVVEGPGGDLADRDLAGRQGRLALAYLALERRHPVATDRLVAAVWESDPPADATGAVAAVVSKLRSALRRVGRCGAGVITSGAGSYHLRLPGGSTVDVEVARTAIDRAEGMKRNGDVAATWADATVATSIASRELLAGESADWLVSARRELDQVARRGYECLAWVWTARGETSLAVAAAERAVALDPLHEPAWRALMTAHAAGGGRAAALRAYARCRAILGDELGIPPDAETEALYTRLVRA